MRESEMGYKVVRQTNNGKLVSVIADGKAQVTYSADHFVQAPKWLGKYWLTFFTSIDTARKFARANVWNGWSISRLQLWRVQCKQTKAIRLPFGNLCQLKLGVKVFARGLQFPENSRMAKKIKLIERIECREG